MAPRDHVTIMRKNAQQLRALKEKSDSWLRAAHRLEERGKYEKAQQAYRQHQQYLSAWLKVVLAT
ncbi:hypothetical protein EBR66_03140 [bacterium]|nr:hypothetical protein [bacterium]